MGTPKSFTDVEHGRGCEASPTDLANPLGLSL